MIRNIEYETPQDFFDILNEEFHFVLDVAANKENAKCERFFTKQDDGLKHPWSISRTSAGAIWMNPPYDRSISLWMEKAYRTAQIDYTVVCLIQGRSTDTKMWHDFVMKSSEIRFIKNRLHFRLNGKSAMRSNMSNVVVIFRPYCKGPPKVSSIDTKARKILPCGFGPSSTQVAVRPRIVCLCGSGRFLEAFKVAEYQETLAGKIVLTIGCNTHDVARSAELAQYKPMLDELHLRKIDLANEVLVLNVGRYIGESTRSEIEYAEAHGKLIRYLESV